VLTQSLDPAPVRVLSRILVTGASGLLGASLCLKLSERGHCVTGLSNNHAIHLPNVASVSVDLLDTRRMREVVLHLEPSAVVHCAAATDVEWCERNKAATMRMNGEVAGELAEACQHVTFVYISTDSVFDGCRGCYEETDSTNPLNVYAASKLEGERAVATVHPAALLLRTNIYGFRLKAKGSLAEWIIGELEAGQPISCFTDVVFSPLFVNDLAVIIEEALAASLAGLYHAGCASAVSKYDFALQLAAITGLAPSLIKPVSLDSARFAAKRPKNVSLLSTKMERALGHPMPPLIEGIRRFVAAREAGFPERLRSSAGGD
jgi:dTDP-4-dehydrorhamnose reductase